MSIWISGIFRFLINNICYPLWTSLYPNFWCLLDFEASYRSWSFPSLPRWPATTLTAPISYGLRTDFMSSTLYCQRLCELTTKSVSLPFFGNWQKHIVSNLWFNPIHFLLESWWWWLSVFKEENPLKIVNQAELICNYCSPSKKIMRIKIECHISCSIIDYSELDMSALYWNKNGKRSITVPQRFP